MQLVRKLLSGWRGLGALTLAVLIVWLAVAQLPDGRLHVYFLDVGQGDAILIVAPDGRQILVDGGPSPGALLNELGVVLPFWDRTLDLVVLTHPDSDHVTGLIPLFERYRVAQVLDTPSSDDAPVAAAWLAALENEGSRRTYAVRGMRVMVDDLRLTVLHPGPEVDWGGVPDNAGSIVLRLDYGATGLLLTGDTETDTENQLIASGQALRANILKAGHHGSNNSTSAAFLAAVQPALVVISVGADNPFGHPHPDMLARLGESIQILRTDLDSRIEVVSDGARIWVEQ